MSNRYLMTFGLLAFVAAFILASAGAINYGCDTHTHIYTVGGILNLLFGGFITYRTWKKSWDEKYVPKK